MADDDIEAAALDWVIRQRDAAFEDWEAFAAWLTADPAHAEIFASVALADQDMAQLLAAAPRPQPVVASSRPPQSPRPRLRTWTGGAIAASVIAIAGVAAWQQLGCPPVLHIVELGPGRGAPNSD